MKKQFFLTLLMVSLFLVSCSKNAEVTQSSTMENSSRIYDEWFDVYQITNASPIFTDAINQNKIDQDYKKEFYINASTTAEFINVQRKYLNIWKGELKYAVDNFTKVLSSDDKDEFLNLQQQWEKSNAENFNFEHKILNEDQYGMMYGTGFNYLFISEQRESYRQRTIRIKYLHYLFEEIEATKDYLSLKFIYQ